MAKKLLDSIDNCVGINGDKLFTMAADCGYGIKRADGKFQFGDYTLNSKLDYNQIISKLKRTSAQAEILKLTIPEGATQDDITEILTAGKYTNITELEQALNSYDFEKFEFVQNLPDRRCRLEGYLPAGEYEIAKGESAVSIVSKMLERFEQTVLTEENKLLIFGRSINYDEITLLCCVRFKDTSDKNGRYR